MVKATRLFFSVDAKRRLKISVVNGACVTVNKKNVGCYK
jgi:hypothetical protein